MKLETLPHLVCPACKESLEVEVFEAWNPGDAEATASNQVAEGVLVCTECATWYPIINHVPVLLDYPVPLHGEFRTLHAGRSNWPTSLHPPQGDPRPGEGWTQRSFSRQWGALREAPLTFSYTHEQRREFIRIELDWPPLLAGKGGRLLDAGCGFGLEAKLLHEATGMEVFAADLNLSLLTGGPRYQAHPAIHLVLASLYRLPFRERSFDRVYSHGVIHHTHSTRDGFDALLAYPKEGGAIYIWVYAHEDFDRGLLRARVGHMLELWLRPWIARLPPALQNLVVYPMSLHHYLDRKRNDSNREQWRFENSVHSMRDRWTCRYAHRHSFNEVIGWFVQSGLDYRLIDPVAYRQAFGYDLIGIGIRGRRAEEPR